MTMAQVRESGLVGCPLCYRSFEQDLSGIIERAQAGATAHAGYHPAHAATLVDRAALRNKLARELRDQLTQLIHEPGGSPACGSEAETAERAGTAEQPSDTGVSGGGRGT
jgi:hypothetical protein